MTIWLSSDFHFRHQAVLKYSKRPFTDIEEMEETIVNNWNSVVERNDECYVLGDVVLGDQKRAIDLLRRMKGRKYLVRGNHDSKLKAETLAQFEWIKDLHSLKVYDPELEDKRQLVVLCHYPLLTWNKAHHGSFHCHGHSHGSLAATHTGRRLDVGVDCWSFFPVSYEQVKVAMAKKAFNLVDHHAESRNREDQR